MRADARLAEFEKPFAETNQHSGRVTSTVGPPNGETSEMDLHH